MAPRSLDDRFPSLQPTLPKTFSILERVTGGLEDLDRMVRKAPISPAGYATRSRGSDGANRLQSNTPPHPLRVLPGLPSSFSSASASTSPSSSPVLPPSPERQLLAARYRYLALLGEGAFSRTVLAHDTHHPSGKRRVAIKIPFSGYNAISAHVSSFLHGGEGERGKD